MTDEAEPRKEHRDGIVGSIHPDELCTTEGVLAKLGIGENKLDELRNKRGLPSYRDGKRLYFKGHELIAAVLSGAVREVR